MNLNAHLFALRWIGQFSTTTYGFVLAFDVGLAGLDAGTSLAPSPAEPAIGMRRFKCKSLQDN